MAWMRLEDAVRDHPKVMEASADLGIHKVQMIGHLVLLWTWALRSAPDGDLRGRSARHVALISEWTGDPDMFVGVLVRCALLDGSAAEGTLRVHDWMEYAAQFREAQRKAKTRVPQDGANKGASWCPGKSRTDPESPQGRRRRRKTKTDLPEREERAPDRTSEPLPVAPEPNPPEAPQRSSEHSAPPSQRREPGDAPRGRPGASGAKVASSSESLPLVEAEPEEKPPLRAVPAAVAFEDFDDDLLDDTTGAAEAIGAWNEHRADEIPPSPTNARGLSSAVLTTIRADRRAEREARERGDVSPPAVPWLHRRSGWVAFAERTRSAAFVRQRMRKTAELAWWVHEANRGGESGAMRRERLFAGAWDELRSGAETAMERNVREAFERARGADDRTEDEPAWAAMLTAGSGAAAVKRR